MITGSEVELHVKCFSEGAKKAGDEFGAAVGSDMFWNAVFGEQTALQGLWKCSGWLSE